MKRSRLGLAALVAHISPAVAGSGGPWYKHESEKLFVESWILTSIIIVAIIFEFVHAHLHHKVGGSHHQKPDELRRKSVANALAHDETINYRLKLLHRTSDEFMVLGYIACVVWLTNRCSGFDGVVSIMKTNRTNYFGPKTASDLLHVVEDVHMYLFAAMALYFASLFMTFRTCNAQVEEWRSHEREYIRLEKERREKERRAKQSGTRTGENAVDEEGGRARKGTTWTVMLNDLFFQEDMSFLRYRSMREQFVKHMVKVAGKYNMESFEDENHLHFNFACYLEVMLDDLMHEFIFVHTATWACLGSVYVVLGLIAGNMNLENSITGLTLGIAGAANLTGVFVMIYVYELYNPNRFWSRTQTENRGKRKMLAKFDATRKSVADVASKTAHAGANAVSVGANVVTNAADLVADKTVDKNTEKLVMRLMQALFMFTSYTIVSFLMRRKMWTKDAHWKVWAVIVAILVMQYFALPYLIPAFNILLRLPPFVDTNELKVVRIILELNRKEDDAEFEALASAAIAVKLAHAFKAEHAEPELKEGAVAHSLPELQEDDVDSGGSLAVPFGKKIVV